MADVASCDNHKRAIATTIEVSTLMMWWNTESTWNGIAGLSHSNLTTPVAQ
ncbi:MAG: hypothetical protein V7L02_09985 [Nostoc sp.]|uniref:hypothetical protein n=1 Tax=Nostoc sp. TaxID=1180 RepID=UPI002FF76D5B